ncbi:MAG: hypothetical protein ACYTEZ_18615 [Planctomycetota bacterium]
MRAALVLLCCAGPLLGGPKDRYADELHPRSLEMPLEIRFAPWYCPLCVTEERIAPATRDVSMMRMPVARLAKVLRLRPDWLVIETPHFKILSTLQGTRVKLHDSVFLRADLERLRTIFPKLVIVKPPRSIALTPHQRAHLYHIKVERIYSHFAALTDNPEPHLGMHAPYELYLFDGYEAHHTLTDRYIGHANDQAGVQHHSREEPNFMAFTTCERNVAKDDTKADKAFSNHVLHNVAHNLVDGHGNYHRETWAWLEEGLGHYYERRDNPLQNTFCRSEGKPPQDFFKPNWEYTIYNLVRRGKDVPFNEWCEKLQPAELRGVEHGLCWSIVRWMIETEPVRFTMMLRKLDDYKEKPDAAACIRYAFGVSPSVLHARWREYVLAHYRRSR